MNRAYGEEFRGRTLGLVREKYGRAVRWREIAARSAFLALKDRWGRRFPSAMEVIGKDLDSLLTLFQFDATCGAVLPTTHPIERLNKEFKRRTRATEVTAGEISTYRCLGYFAQTMESRWSFHPLSQWSSVYTQVAAWPVASRSSTISAGGLRCASRKISTSRRSTASISSVTFL